MFFHSKDFKELNEKDCKIVMEIETREGFAPMYRVRFNHGKKPMDIMAFADELKGEKDYVSDEEREAYIAERDAREPKIIHKVERTPKKPKAKKVESDGDGPPQDS